MKMIEIDTIPCWYQLSFDASVPAILLKAHKDFLADCPSLEKAPCVAHFMEKFQFSRFESDIENGNFGFEGAFERIGEENGFVVFKIVIPVAEKQSEIICPICCGDGKSLFGKCFKCRGKCRLPEICPRCEGGKKDEYGSVCLECMGKGRKTYIDWNCLYAVSASFSVFFDLASLQLMKDKTSSCRFPQLILVNTITEQEMHGGSLDGTYSVPLAKWLSLFQPNTEITEMTKAMLLVWEKMFGKVDEYEKHNFYATVANKNGWLNVSCSGNRCGLYPADSWGPELGRGYNFSCHNVDNPMQQITLLAGLAALHDKAKKEIRF